MNSIALLFYVLLAFADEQSPEVDRESPFAARPLDRLYWSEGNCCGLIAAFMISDDLERPTNLTELAQQLPFGAAGTSMTALVEYFRERGLHAEGFEVSARNLYEILAVESDLRAVALLRPNHWVSLFGAQNGRIHAFLYPEWVEMPLSEFEERFTKHVILVSTDLNELDQFAGWFWVREPQFLLLTVFLGATGMWLVCRFREARLFRHSHRSVLGSGVVDKVISVCRRD